MDYRREIDGLRALAVLPVLLFHAGFQTFSGGFVGVDVFFVISGYLITTIILAELDRGRFSVIRFYERRARRILPALFFIMGVSSIFAYAWMMPDEFKNFGQSVFATVLFSNNILLAITSGYWDLASEFKPLLHTWSLGVEEQYYVIFPFLLLLGWKHFKRHLVAGLWAALVLSLFLAVWGLMINPTVTFYVLPARAWEILIGALAAFHLQDRQAVPVNPWAHQLLSLAGLLLVSISVFFFNQDHPSPGFYSLVPTVGAVLIIVFASGDTLVGGLLGHRWVVGIGLISYSLYLWHQPLLAFARIYLVNPPGLGMRVALVAASFFFAYLTWKFVEKPFRAKGVVSRQAILVSSVTASLVFILFGYFLNRSYGIPSRIYDPDVRIQDMDKRFYNERVFDFKRDAFVEAGKLKILVVGNSAARDFVNMTTETFDMKGVEVVYRDDLGDCIFPFKGEVARNLYGAANVIVFAGGLRPECLQSDLSFAGEQKKRLFYIGVKHFGYNLNWLIRLDRASLPSQFNPLLNETVQQERAMSSLVPMENFISLLSPIVRDGRIPITDGLGRMLSTDRVHVTKYGAQFFGEHALSGSRYGDLLVRKSFVAGHHQRLVD